jgi:hypothetical protein
MASIVSAGTTSATALNMSADTSGVLQLASNNGTVALVIDTGQRVNVGTAAQDTNSKFQVSDPVTGSTFSNAALFARSSTDTSTYYTGARIALQNTSATSGNFSSIGFGNANSTDVAAIYATITTHTGGAGVGTLSFATNNGGVAATSRMAISAAGYVTKSSQPNFRATNGSGNIVAKGDVVFTSKDWDVTSSYSTSTGRFTAPITGYYLFSLTALYQNAGSSPTWKINIMKNGVQDCVTGESQSNIWTSYNVLFNGSQIVSMVAGDYVNIYNDGTATVSSVHISSTQTKFSGYLLG